MVVIVPGTSPADRELAVHRIWGGRGSCVLDKCFEKAVFDSNPSSMLTRDRIFTLPSDADFSESYVDCTSRYERRVAAVESGLLGFAERVGDVVDRQTGEFRVEEGE